MVVELITKNVIIGTVVVLLNVIPLLLKKYSLIPITVTVSILLMIIGNYF